jgi:hypothetical protein
MQRRKQVYFPNKDASAGRRTWFGFYSQRGSYEKQSGCCTDQSRTSESIEEEQNMSLAYHTLPIWDDLVSPTKPAVTNLYFGSPSELILPFQIYQYQSRRGLPLEETSGVGIASPHSTTAGTVVSHQLREYRFISLFGLVSVSIYY